jgi:hypothetical protein
MVCTLCWRKLNATGNEGFYSVSSWDTKMPDAHIRYMYGTSLEIPCIPNSTRRKNHLLVTWLLNLLSEIVILPTLITSHLCQELQHRHTQNHIHLGKVCFILWPCSPGSLNLNEIVLVDGHYLLPLLSLLANEPRLMPLGLPPPCGNWPYMLVCPLDSSPWIFGCCGE